MPKQRSEVNTGTTVDRVERQSAMTKATKGQVPTPTTCSASPSTCNTHGPCTRHTRRGMGTHEPHLGPPRTNSRRASERQNMIRKGHQFLRRGRQHRNRIQAKGELTTLAQSCRGAHAHGSPHKQGAHQHMQTNSHSRAITYTIKQHPRSIHPHIATTQVCNKAQEETGSDAQRPR